MQIPFLPSPNFRHPARPRTISAVVLHTSDTLHGTTVVDWMRRPEARFSVHFVIERTGEMLQLVADEAIAWHAGRSAMRPNDDPPSEVNVNEFSLGVMLVGTQDAGYTDRQMAALYTLLEHLVVKHRIAPERIVGHEHVAPGRHHDPSGFIQQFNWRRVHEVATAAYARACPSS